jgi:hypothetical protein
MEKKITKAEPTKVLTVIKKEVESIKTASRFRVTSKPTYNQAVDQLSLIKKAKNMIKENYTDKIVKPAKEAYDNAKDFIKPYEADLKRVEDYLKGECIKFDDLQQKIAEEKKREFEESLKRGELTDKQIDKAIDKIEQKENTVSGIRELDVVVVDDISRVPVKYLKVDEVLAKKELKLGPIPGMHLEKRKTMANNF